MDFYQSILAHPVRTMVAPCENSADRQVEFSIKCRDLRENAVEAVRNAMRREPDPGNVPVVFKFTPAGQAPRGSTPPGFTHPLRTRRSNEEIQILDCKRTK